MIPRSATLIGFSLLVAAPLVGCDDDHGSGTDMSPVEEACGHAKNGPYADVRATAARADAPDGTAKHTAVRVALTDVDFDGQTGKGGYVAWEVDEATEFEVFLSADVPLKACDATGTEIPVEAAEATVSECAEIAVTHTFDFEIGTVVFRIGPDASATTVSLMVEEAAGLHGNE